MKYYFKKKFVYIALISLAFITSIIYFSNPAIAIGVFGTGLASFAGALAAFTFEKEERNKNKRNNEQEELLFIQGVLAVFASINKKNMFTLARQRNRIHSVNVYKMVAYNLDLNLRNISFLSVVNNELFKNIAAIKALSHEYSNKVMDYNSLTEIDLINRELPTQCYSEVERVMQNIDLVIEETIPSLAIIIESNYQKTS